jgi:hypothetical protein
MGCTVSTVNAPILAQVCLFPLLQICHCCPLSDTTICVLLRGGRRAMVGPETRPQGLPRITLTPDQARLVEFICISRYIGGGQVTSHLCISAAGAVPSPLRVRMRHDTAGLFSRPR